MTQTQRIKDWKKGRELYEREGKTYREIGEIIGAHEQTVAAHAEMEAWINPQRVLHESRPERVAAIIEGFIEQDRACIAENLSLKHSINRRILGLVQRHVERLERGITLKIVKERMDGDVITVDEDVVTSLGRLALCAQRVEAIDKSLADLKESGWRTPEKKTEEKEISESLTPTQVEAILAGLEKPDAEAEMN